MTSDPYRYGQQSQSQSRSRSRSRSQPYGASFQPWSAPAAPTAVYASLWSRIGALLIDCVLYIALYLLVTTLTGGFSTNDGQVSFGATGVTAVLLWLAGPLYWIGLEATTGATLGKRALSLRVVSADGGPISVGQAVVRYLLLVVDSFPFGLVGLITAKASNKRQRVGDRIAKTVVVRAD